MRSSGECVVGGDFETIHALGVAFGHSGNMVQLGSVPIDHVKGDSAVSSGQAEVDFARNQVGDGDEIAEGAVSAGFGLGGLHEAVDAFDQAVSDSAVEPGQDAIAVLVNRAGRLLYRVKPRSDRPAVPAVVEPGGPVPFRAAIDSL